MFLCDQSTRKSFPLRAKNVVIGVPSPGGLFGRSGPSRFASTKDADEVADIVVMSGKFYCYVDGRRVELRLSGEAIALIRARGR